MQKHTDEELWILYLQGNDDAFEELYKRYYTLLYNYGSKFISVNEVVHDAIQNLFLKIMSNRKNLSYTSSFKGYLLKAFRNSLYDLIEKRKIQTQFIFIDEVEDSLCIEEEKDEDEEHIDIMREAYKELSPKQKEIIYLYYVRKLSHNDIGELLGINTQSSKNLLYRSIVVLKEKFFKKKSK